MLFLGSGPAAAQSAFAVSATSTPSAQQGAAYAVQFTATGGVLPYIWSVSSGTLPPGLTLSDFGQLAGTPTAAGTYTFGVQVHDCSSDQQSAGFSVTLQVYPPLTVAGGSLSDGSLAVPYSQTVSASGGAGPYTFAVAGGALPDGLALSASGRLFGTPSKAGSFAFSVRATDSTGAAGVGSFSLNIQGPAVTLAAPAALPDGVVSSPYPSQVLTVSGGTGPYTFSASGSNQPPGLTLNSNGALSGMPVAAGNYTITVTATDSLGATSTSTLAIAVKPFSPTLVISTGALSFSLIAGNTVLPDSQAIQVQSSDVTKILPYTVSGGDSWLTISAGSGSTPGVVSVALSQQALSLAPVTPGSSPYQTTLTIACPSGSLCTGTSETVTVSLTVKALPPQLTIANDSIAFTTTAAAPQGGSQSLGIQNSGGGSLGIASSTSCGASWCRISGIPGSVGAGATSYATVTVDPTGLGAGYYLTSATVVSSAGAQSVPVSLFIAKNDSLGLAPGGDQFQIPAGSPVSFSPPSFLVSASGTNALPWTASVLPGAPWLQLAGTASGSSTSAQPVSAGYKIDPAAAAALSPGTYYGTIRVTSPSAVNSPLDYQVVLNVTASGDLPKPYPAPAGLVFAGPASASIAPQTVGVYASSSSPISYQASAATTDGASWLSVSPAKDVTSASGTAQSTISVQTAGLAPGVYYGGVSYAFEAAAVRTVNVTLIVEPTGPAAGHVLQRSTARDAASCAPSTLVPAQIGLVNSFAAPASWPTPLAIQLLDDCGNLISKGQVVATFSNGDPPLVLALADASSALYAGTWSPRQQAQQIAIQSRAAAPGFSAVTTRITGAVTPNNAPILNHNGTMNLYAPQAGAALAPGTLVQINGSYLASQPSSSTSVPLPTSLGGTSVIIGGVQAAIASVSPSQIVAQVPFELGSSNQYQVVVSANGALTTPDTLQTQPASPGLKASAAGYVLAQHADGTTVSDAAPAVAGESITLIAAGMGLTNQTIATGAAAPVNPPAQPVLAPAVTLDSTQVTVSSAELIPGQVGVYRIVMQVPPFAKSGDLALVVTQGGQTASGILAVQ